MILSSQTQSYHSAGQLPVLPPAIQAHPFSSASMHGPTQSFVMCKLEFAFLVTVKLQRLAVEGKGRSAATIDKPNILAEIWSILSLISHGYSSRSICALFTTRSSADQLLPL